MESGRKHRRSFSKQFKTETVALIHSSGKSIPQVCRDLDLAESVVRRWVAQAEIDVGMRAGRTTDQAARIAELERENRELRRANAILKSASAFFAAELDRPQR